MVREARKGKLPLEAFYFYVNLGPSRSYAKVADEYECSEQAVFMRARRDHWQERLTRLELRATEKLDAAAVESIEEMNARHIRDNRMVQEVAKDALVAGKFSSPEAAARAYDAAVARERLVRGQVSERVSVDTIGDLCARAYAEEQAELAGRVPSASENGHGNGQHNGHHGNGAGHK